ncbi:hypothetical protein [Halarchaeum sp. P4]|uniref:hypothetical protein n=1 Tax=Halarchaeum sp. P4 TaxID=3421639 RepID=UPI003EC02148
MSDTDKGYTRRRPALPRTYHVYEVGDETRILLGTPVVDALDAEPGDAVSVARNNRGEVVLSAEGDDE